ncbi:MAG TPA: ribonuclease HII, partial [Treponema sp.]|nr:ribonuclease HII [Treponema sp.]
MNLICGLDEAGRGPLAGPVVAGCVILPENFPVEILNDSKKLSEKKRVAAEKIIKEKTCWGIGIIDHETIDKINILQASMQAMKNAYEMMMIKLP